MRSCWSGEACTTSSTRVSSPAPRSRWPGPPGTELRSGRPHQALRDRAGRARTIAGATFGIGSLRGYAPRGAISPDGATAAVFEPSQGPAPVLDLLELRSGARHRVAVDLTEGTDEGTVAWSPDSRWLFVVDATGELHVVDPGSGTVSRLLPDLPRLVQLSVRPAREVAPAP